MKYKQIVMTMALASIGFFAGAFISKFVATTSAPKVFDVEELFYFSQDNATYENIVHTGDSVLYRKYVEDVQNEKGFANHLQLSIIMADKFQYVPAYYDVYLALTKDFCLDELDEETRAIALSFLKRGASLGDKRAIERVSKLM